MPDLRATGSGNIGATNVLRTGNKKLAAATLLGDVLKGTLAVLIVKYEWGADAAIPAALGAFLGHLFPVWLGFKGGKGVATYIGILLGLAWPAALTFCAVWAAVAAVTRYSSLAALIASITSPLVLWLLGYQQEAQLFVLLSALLWIMHRANIQRLMAGTEGKIGA
jgi:glycerol-3-phosphate acyltransferase PlsY